MKNQKTAPWRPIAALLLPIALTAACATPTPPTINLDSEPTEDGLYEVSNTEADMAWVRSDANLGQYSKIILRGVGIEYRPGGETRTNRFARASGEPFAVSEEQREQFQEIANEEILEELGDSQQFALVSEPGPDVLLVTVALGDLVSYIAPDAPLSQVYLSEVGEATLVLELRDSTTNVVLARSADRRVAERIDRGLEISVRASTDAEVKRLFNDFGNALRRQLDELGGLGN